MLADLTAAMEAGEGSLNFLANEKVWELTLEAAAFLRECRSFTASLR